MRKKERILSVALSKKRLVYFQVAVAIYVCLYRKLVTHTRTIGQACKSLRVLLYQTFDLMEKAKDTG
jgi:hypothetical protein